MVRTSIFSVTAQALKSRSKEALKAAHLHIQIDEKTICTACGAPISNEDAACYSHANQIFHRKCLKSWSDDYIRTFPVSIHLIIWISMKCKSICYLSQICLKKRKINLLLVSNKYASVNSTRTFILYRTAAILLCFIRIPLVSH